MKHWVFVALIAAGCGGKKDAGDEGGGGSADKSEDPPAAAGGMPAALSAWMPKGAEEAWQGAWSSRLTLRRGGTMSMAGDPAAIEIAGDQAKVFDGKTEHQLAFALAAPCSAELKQKLDGGATATHDKTFLVRDGKLQVGEGSVGYRKGKSAVVCTTLDGVYVVDDKGCATWSKRFGDEWESKPGKCAWSTADGKDVLTLGEGTWARKVTADGDYLVSDQFVDEVKLTTKMASFDEAKADVTARIKEHDPGERAKAAGGEVGKTDTVRNLVASYAADKASLDGKQIELTAQYFSTSTMTANGKKSYSVSLVDSKDTNKITVSCDLAGEPPDGLVQYDKVTVKGTVKESFGRAGLVDCAIAKAR